MIDFVSAFRDEKSNGRPRCQYPAFDLIHRLPEDAKAMLIEYQAKMVKQDLAASTINRRLATLRAWVRYAQKKMQNGLSPDDLIGELSTNTEPRAREIASIALACVCAHPHIFTLRGLRDVAILHLICEAPVLG